MSNPLNVKLKIFIRDVLSLPESQILSGRNNKVQEDFDTDYVVVDELAPSERVAGNITFDGQSEVQNIANNYITTFTVDFYGNNAYDNCNNFILLARSQAAYELKKNLDIAIYQVSSMQDLKKLTGQQYGNRYQATFKVEDCRSVNVNTLRIDEAQIETITS